MMPRWATLADVDPIAKHAVAIAMESEGRRLELAATRNAVESCVRQSHARYVACDDSEGQVVASMFVTKEWSDWTAGWYWWYQGVYVEPSARGSGAYRAMHAFLVEEARKAGDVRELRLYVHEENVQGSRAHEALGFQLEPYRVYGIPVPRA